MTSHIRTTHTHSPSISLSQSLTLDAHNRSRTVRVSAAELILGLAVSVSWGLEYKSAFTIQSGRAGLCPGSPPRRPSVTQAILDRKETGLLLSASPRGSWPSRHRRITVTISRFAEVRNGRFLFFLRAHLHTRRASNTHTHP